MLDKKNSITSITKRHGSSNRTHYIFLCKCGKKLTVRSDALKKHPGHCSVCGHRKRPYETHYNGLKQSARKRKLKFKLSYNEFVEFTKNKTCIYCEIELNWKPFTTYKNLEKRTFMDRIDNNIGYQKDNIVPCCPSCNFTRGDRYSYDEFLLFKPILMKIKANR